MRLSATRSNKTTALDHRVPLNVAKIIAQATRVAGICSVIYTEDNVPKTGDRAKERDRLQDGYYRFPTVNQDIVVFVAEDDLWQVPLLGGTARRLTNGLGSVSHPHFSPDGQWLAFVGKEEGDPEVYVMPSQGGPVRRLTFLASGAAVVGWHPDGRIIFSTYYGSPFMAWRSLYAVYREGGEPKLLPYGRVAWASFGPDGRTVLGRPTTDTSYWKRYRGGTRGVLWIDNGGNGNFQRFAREDGNLVTPLWIGDRIYMISDQEDHANLYSMRPDGTDMQRHTNHQDYYIRNLDTNGSHIVYSAGGDLYRYDLTQGTSEKIAVEFHSQRTQREVKHVNAAEYWSDYTFLGLSESLLITARGKVFQVPPFAGPVGQLGATQGVRYRLTQAIDDEHIITVSDEGGEDHLEIRLVGPEPVQTVTRIPLDVGIIEELQCAPNGQFAAFSTERQQLWLLDLKTLDLSLIAETTRDHVAGFDWSPDSRWLAYALPGTFTTPIYLFELATKISHQVTHPVLMDRRPVFDPNGHYLYFLSQRVFKPIADHLKFERSFPKGEVPCLITLARDTTSPFIPKPKPLIAPKDREESSDGDPAVQIDLEDIQERVLAFPVSEAIFHDIAAGHNQIFWSKSEPRSDPEEIATAGQPPAYAQLIRYDLTDLKEETLADQITSFTLSNDRKLMAVRIRSELHVLQAGHKIDMKEKKPGPESGIVDLQRIHVSIEPLAEWYQMQRDAWRQMREIFWVSDMGGVDWDDVYDRYRTLLPRLTSRSEFADLMWEMQGELGSSHAYESGGHYRSEPRHKVGFLGAQYRWNEAENGYAITHLVRGDSANPGTTSPLLTPGANIMVSDIITAINGMPLGPDLPPGARLIDTGRQDVGVTVKGANGDSRTVTVRPLASETPARYREWVENNRRTVHEKTDGRVGYIHIPNMVNTGFGEFHRSYLAEYDREGLIVDVRYNSGGIVSPLILEILNRKRIAFTRWRGGYVQAYPYESPSGAMVAITNEQSGSDGDIFSHNFKLMQLGPLIGTRTWGGVIGIGPRYPLVDWTIVSQPEMAFWFKDVGLGVENYGTDPDIWVDETPQATAVGIDDQLDRSIQEILKILANFNPLQPDYEHRPNRQPKPLA